LRGRVRRDDPQRAALLVWGLWLLVTGLTFSFMAGIFHSYYTVALAPAIAALIGAGSVLAWRHRHRYQVRLALSASTLAAVATAWVLLGRSAEFLPWLRWVVLGVGIIGAIALLIPAATRGRISVATILAVMFAGLAGPTAYAVDTIGTAHTGSIVSAGPATGTGIGGPGMGRPGMDAGRGMGGPDGGAGFAGQAPPTGQMPTGQLEAGQMPAGGLLNSSAPSADITAMLEADADSYTWVAAAIGSNSASGYQLAAEEPVMAIGGFNGTDPSPTLEEFVQYVADGEIHYFIAGGGMGFGMGGGEAGTSTQISGWVAANYTSTTVDGVTLYDLSE